MTRLVAVACIGALGLLPAVQAHALTTSEQIAVTSREIDATAQRWFTAQADAARIDASIADVEHQISTAQGNIARARKIATARAVVVYKNGDVGFTSLFGDNVLDSARRAQLVVDANAGGDAAIAQLTAAVDNLKSEQHALVAARTQQEKTLREVSTERVTLDAELTVIRTQARQNANVALAAAHNRAARSLAAGHVRALAAVQPTNTLAAPTAPVNGSDISLAAVAAAPPSGSGVSPHHDDPFLVCTRNRESGGNYSAVSPSGYYGAYQFLPSTWDSAAVHAGRLDLVGVLPSRASAPDQDDVAWALYQWQGTGPWGGRC